MDNEGRTPLHYAPLVKDDDRMFDYLIVSGADESALDNVSTLKLRKTYQHSYSFNRNNALQATIKQETPISTQNS